MILNRIGNKSRIAQDIIKEFPPHKTYIELFFGGGGIFFNKPLAAFNVCNDIEDNVFNLWRVLQTSPDALIDQIKLMPLTHSLMKYWAKNQEEDPVKKAARFVMLSNFGINGRSTSLRFGPGAGNEKKYLMTKVEKTLLHIKNVKFMCEDFRECLKRIHFRDEKKSAFIYADPPYLNTMNNYKNGFTPGDAADLFDLLTTAGVKFAISEFNNPTILELAEKHQLNVVIIGERQNLKNRRTEILVTNYQGAQLSLF